MSKVKAKIGQFPVKKATLRSAYGDWLHRRSHTNKWRHAGIDIHTKGKSTALVYAPIDGIVVRTEINPKKGSGFGGYGPCIVIIKGIDGNYWLMAHLDGINVEKKQKVKQGEIIGHYGDEINHVHFEIRTQLMPGYRDKKEKSDWPWSITINPKKYIVAGIKEYASDNIPNPSGDYPRTFEVTNARWDVPSDRRWYVRTTTEHARRLLLSPKNKNEVIIKKGPKIKWGFLILAAVGFYLIAHKRT